MYYAIFFLLCSLAAAWAAVGPGGWRWALALPVFVLAFLLMHLLYALFWWLLSLPVDRSKPIEKQNLRSRAGCRGFGRFMCLYAGIRPRFKGLDKLPEDRTFLYISNHRSLFDPILVMGYLDKYNITFISKPSNMAIPLAGDVAYNAGYLAIDRENDRAALKTILTAADYMKRGVCSIGIYPEGTRSRNGQLLPFHHGSFKAAQRAGVPVAVVCTRGTERVMKRLFLRPTVVELEVLELIPAERVKAMSTAALAEYCRAKIEEALEQ